MAQYVQVERIGTMGPDSDSKKEFSEAWKLILEHCDDEELKRLFSGVDGARKCMHVLFNTDESFKNGPFNKQVAFVRVLEKLQNEAIEGGCFSESNGVGLYMIWCASVAKKQSDAIEFTEKTFSEKRTELNC